jgi:hypothetical protein
MKLSIINYYRKGIDNIPKNQTFKYITAGSFTLNRDIQVSFKEKASKPECRKQAPICC